MVDLTIRGGTLDVRMIGLASLWSLKRRLRIPLASIRGVRHDPAAARVGGKGWRMPGTHIPGLIAAGTFYKGGEKLFWDVRRPERALVIDLEFAPYDRLIVEVRDPEACVRLIRAAIGQPLG